MNHIQEYEYFVTRIEQMLDSVTVSDNLVIYPFGRFGVLVKQILNSRYGIKEAFICDDKLSKRNHEIKSLAHLSQVDTSQYHFVITSDNPTYYYEIRRNLRKYVREENIIDFFSDKPPLSDNPRIASLELAAREIYDKKIEGAAAEAGVYRGDFASNINRFFYDRKLYLFDTFEGFDSKDIDVDRKNGDTVRNAGHYGDTSVNIVLDKMPYADNVVVKKGYFPDTAEGLDEQFCFVSLDMDLYQPIKAGLEYFYPKLTGGGYIFVHDCNINHVNYRGARKALMEFVDKEKIGYVMMADNRTAVITK